MTAGSIVMVMLLTFPIKSRKQWKQGWGAQNYSSVILPKIHFYTPTICSWEFVVGFIRDR